MWVFERSLAVSVWIFSQQLCGMQSSPLEMTLCWDLRLFVALFFPQVLYSQLPRTWIVPFVLSPFSCLSPTHSCFFWLQLNLHWTTQAYACYWAQDCSRILQELHMTCAWHWWMKSFILGHNYWGAWHRTRKTSPFLTQTFAVWVGWIPGYQFSMGWDAVGLFIQLHSCFWI